MPWKHMECAPKCRSKRHAYALHTAITKGSLKEVKGYFSLCHAAGKVNDIYGRCALHLAASCGKVDVIEWLLEEMKGDLGQKDLESGWTALHRAVFYGQLGTARMLIQYKSELFTRDHEGLGPLDIAMKDRQLVKAVPPPVYSLTDRHEVYTWGDNANFTLGQVTEHRLHTPEVIDEFRKHNIDLRKIVMCKFHSVFITKDGRVYTCGQGHGGRLGHPTEDICVVPKLVEAMKNEECVEAAASRDHTLLLTQSGIVYSFGLNDYRQLGQITGQDKCLIPHPINSKMLKGKPVKGICTGRFHSVVYTANAVFTCGLNAGQLGHPQMGKGEQKLAALRQVSALNIQSISIVSVVCSDAATIIYTTTGEIFVLHEYLCRRITSNRTDVKQLHVIGGNLDYTDMQNLRENGGTELIISYLNESGKVFIWRQSSPSLKRVNWLIKRQLYIVDYVLTITSLAVVTDCGDVFVGTLSNKAPPVREPIRQNKESTEGEFGRVTLMDLIMQEEIEEVQVKKVPNIHRAMYITADRKGHNYATLQSLPNSCLTDVPVVSNDKMREDFSGLLDEADEYDLIHDLIVEVNGQRWPVHKYILVSRCSNFHSMFPKCVLAPSDSLNIPSVKISDIHPQILEQLLLYIYTDTCELLSIGAKFVLTDNQSSSMKDNIYYMDVDVRDVTQNMTDYHSVSAYQVLSQNKKKSKETKKRQNQGKNFTEDRNPVKMLTEMAKRWGVKGLSKRLECVVYQNGYIKSNGKPVPSSSLQFYRDKMKDTKLELYDVNLKSEDGVLFPCHKCVLVARLEYFHSMLATGWMETSTSKALALPVQSDILGILLDFLYTDVSPIVQRTQNVEFLCNILVVADQMLVIRLKEMCEVTIATLITMKNVGELLEFASTYNAVQLQSTCQQYIVLNLANLLENRYLDNLSDDVIDDLTIYYRQTIENMSRRLITPYDDSPDKEFLGSLVENDDGDPSSLSLAFDAKKAKPKKKRVRTRSSTEDRKKGIETAQLAEKGGRRLSERHISVSSDISVKSDDELTDVVNMDSKHGSLPGYKQLEINIMDSTVKDENSNSLKQSGLFSPTTAREPVQSPTGCLSLREIMEQEKSESSNTQTPSSQKSGRFSWKGIKKQQRDHVKTASNKDKQETKEAETKSAGICPWGSVNKTVQSFRSLMIEEQTVKPSPASKQESRTAKSRNDLVTQTISDSKQRENGIGKSQSVVGRRENPSSIVKTTSVSKGLENGIGKNQTTDVRQTTSSETKQRKNKSKSILSWGLPSSGSVTPSIKIDNSTLRGGEDMSQGARSPENPWNMTVAQSPTDKTCSFTDIVQDEKEKVEVLTKTLNKPLGLIQIEEQAIQDLLFHYKAKSGDDEHISVERVNQVAAAPIWKRERLTSTSWTDNM